MDPRSVAAALKVEPPIAGRPHLGRDGPRPDGRRRSTAGPPAPTTRSPSTPGALAATGRAAGQPGPGGLPDPRRRPAPRSPPPSRAGKRVAVGTAFLITLRPARSSPRRSRRPSGSSRRSRASVTADAGRRRPRRPTRSRPTKALRPNTATGSSSTASATPTACASPRSTASVRTAAARRRSSASGRATTRRTSPRDAAISVRFTRADGPHARPRRRSRSPPAGKPVAGKVTFAEDDTVLVFVPAKALPYGAKVVMQVAAGARTQDGAALATAADGCVQDRQEAGREQDDVGAPGRRIVDRRRSRGRWRQLGRGRDLLPRADELHPDRRLGHLERQLQQPGRPQRRAAQARPRDQQQGLAAVRQEARGRRRLQPLHRRQPRRPAPPGRLHELPLGREPRLPVGQPARRRSSARTSSSRARSRTSGGHYVNLMNAKYDRVGIGVWVSHGRVRLVIDFYHP